MAHMRAAKRQEQSPAHGVPDVPRTTQGWRGRGLAEERNGAPHVTELTRGAIRLVVNGGGHVTTAGCPDGVKRVAWGGTQVRYHAGNSMCT